VQCSHICAMQTRLYGLMGTKLGDAAVNWLPTAANTLNRAQLIDSRRQRLRWLILTAWRLQSGFLSDGAVAEATLTIENLFDLDARRPAQEASDSSRTSCRHFASALSLGSSFRLL
jgi:hypothetical protein